ncbi:MAG: hypothetical protein NWF01_06580 [Candidatus Bathyarchaeota archaeon]|nr:hypothetical protein [Candidatus Bathyarchaeota archaeon]
MRKKIILSICVFALLVPLFYCGTGVKADGAWTYQTLIPNAKADSMAVAYDSSGNPHIAYHTSENYIMYASPTDSGWATEIVDAGNNTLTYVSLAIGSDDKPYLAYFGGSNNDLKCAHLNGETWIVETVDSDMPNYPYLSLALDSGNNPNIAYISGNSKSLTYASWTGSTWSKSELPVVGNGPSSCSLIIDLHDKPHIAFVTSFTIQYQDSIGFNVVRKLEYATLTGSEWTVTYTGAHSLSRYDRLTMPSITLDSKGNPHIFVGGSDVPSWYARWTGSEWVAQEPQQDDRTYAGGCSLALDSNNNPYVSFTVSVYLSSYSSIRYYGWGGSGWTAQTVDFQYNLGLSGTTLHLDSSGNPIIYYSRNGDLGFAYISSTVTVTFNQKGASSDANILTVDSVTYKASDLPVTLTWNTGSKHSFSYNTVNTNSDQRIAWTSTAGISKTQTGTLTAIQSGNITATFQTQYKVTLQTNPSGSGSLSPSESQIWAQLGEEIYLSATGKSGYTFANWTCSTSQIGLATTSSSSTRATITGPGTITANFEGNGSLIDVASFVQNNTGLIIGVVVVAVLAVGLIFWKIKKKP